MVGISDGAVLQRGKNETCDFYISGCMEKTLSYRGMAVCGEAKLAPAGEGRYRVTGIPTGGPYTVTLGNLSFRNIYVGDVWILAGQSNMEGNGLLRKEDKNAQSDSEIRAFYMTGKWGSAAHPLHTPWKSADAIHRQLPGLDEAGCRYRGVGPGLMFARRMKEITNVPQGVLCCAHGGTTIKQWSADLADQGENSLLGSLLKTVTICGGNAAGLFWYQGCSEAMGDNQAVRNFSKETIAVFETIRNRLHRQIPIVQAQISRMTNCFFSEDADLGFSIIREQQRSMVKLIDGLAVISTISEELDDLIHLSANSQDSVGYRAANAMAGLIYGEKESFLSQPEYCGYRIEKDSHNGAAILYVYYKHVDRGLHANGRAVGFRIGRTPFGIDNRYIFNVQVKKDHVVLRLTLSPDEVKGKYLCYGTGTDPICNIFDEGGRPIHAMAGILLE